MESICIALLVKEVDEGADGLRCGVIMGATGLLLKCKGFGAQIACDAA